MHEDFALMAALWWDNLWSSAGRGRKSFLYEYPAEVQSTDLPCALDVCNTARSFTHESNTCVIRRWLFLILGFIDLSCTPSPATLLWPSLGGVAGSSHSTNTQEVRKSSTRSVHFNTLQSVWAHHWPRATTTSLTLFVYNPRSSAHFSTFLSERKASSENDSIFGLVCWSWTGWTDCKRVEAAAGHQGRSTPSGEKIGLNIRVYLIFSWYRG